MTHTPEMAKALCKKMRQEKLDKLARVKGGAEINEVVRAMLRKLQRNVDDLCYVKPQASFLNQGVRDVMTKRLTKMRVEIGELMQAIQDVKK